MAKKIKVKDQRVPRNKEKYPALNHKRAVANRRELIDYDYLDKLSPEEKEWLNNFTEEYIIANFDHRGDKLDDSKEAKKKSYDANNARNRCMYTKAKTTKLLDNSPTEEWFHSKLVNKSVTAYSNIEDVLIESIELKDRLKKRRNRNKRSKRTKNDPNSG